MSGASHDDERARRAREGAAPKTPVAAATVVVLRGGDEGLETLMLRRNSKIAFGGMWVFPGGRVDPQDAKGLAPGDDLAIARVAAIREAREEAGLMIAPDRLVPLSHWTPPPIAPKRFLTWFFLAPTPSNRITIDHGEIHEHAWMSPIAALEKRDAGEIELAPPTFVTLHGLARSSSVARGSSPPTSPEAQASWHGGSAQSRSHAAKLAHAASSSHAATSSPHAACRQVVQPSSSPNSSRAVAGAVAAASGSSP